MRTIFTTLIAALATTFFFFQFGILGNWGQTAVALLIVFVISFLFTTVAANAIAIVGSNPVSGMTLMTLILASLVLVSIGLNGTAGMTAALIIGGVVCTALLDRRRLHHRPEDRLLDRHHAEKTGELEIPRRLRFGRYRRRRDDYSEQNLRLRPRQPAGSSAGQCHGRRDPTLMQGGTAPWVLYFCGAVLALVLTGIGIPALPFALGMFLPLQLNLPLLIGGLIAWFVSTRSKDQALNKARMSQGTLIASGFIAGGALMGVVGAILKFADVDWKLTQWNSSNAASWVGLGMYLALIIYFAVHSLRAKKEE